MIKHLGLLWIKKILISIKIWVSAAVKLQANPPPAIGTVYGIEKNIKIGQF